MTLKRQMITHGYSQAELDEQYFPSAVAAQGPSYFAAWSAASEEARKSVTCRLDVSYGASSSERLDIFTPAVNPTRTVLVFMHGGYWRSQDKAVFSYLAEPFVRAGIAVVLPNYGLCPSVSIDELVTQCGAAVRWVSDHADSFGADSGRVFISGHSAGGHIVGMCLSDPDAPPIRGAIALSGLFDLETIRLTFLNDLMMLTPDQAQRNSPQLVALPTKTPLILSLGDDETEEFHRQTNDFAEHWKALGNEGVNVPAPGRHHYSVLDDFIDGSTSLGNSVIEMLQS